MKRSASYMHEVNGVRGIALTLVVLFHLVGQGRVSGGVDVFLVISAFFLTRKLLKNADAQHEVSSVRAHGKWITTHFIHVLTRLIPSAAIVLAGVLVATVLISPSGAWLQSFREVIASALYYENWELISSQLEYGAAGPNTSALQHFWSLSIQGQFFLVWPLIALGVTVLMRRATSGFRPVFFAVIAILTTASFAWAVVSVRSDQPVAYLDTFARFWELGVGALVAFVPAALMASARVRECAVWLGLALIVATGFVIDGGALYPGVAALLPVGATALVLFGASRDAAPGLTSRILALAPVTFAARISYPLYLWHWPVLIFYMQYQGYDRVGWKGALLILAVSIALATATERLVGGPLLERTDRASLRKRMLVALTPIATIVVVSLVASTIHSAVLAETKRVGTEVTANHVGARVLTTPTILDSIATDIPAVPAPPFAKADEPEIYKQGCIQKTGSAPGRGEVLVCDVDNYGDKLTVVLTGASKSVQWYPAVQMLAKENNWRLIVIDKTGCSLTKDPDVSVGDSCIEWNRQLGGALSQYEPDVVITTATRTSSDPEVPEDIPHGRIEAWEEIDELGIPIIAIRDTPRFPYAVPGCLERNQQSPQVCSLPRVSAFTPGLLDLNQPLATKYHFVDMTDALCGPTMCEPIVGNVVVYRDGHHLTATYVRTMSDALADALQAAMPELF